MLELVRGIAFGFSAAATPGPFQAWMLAQTLRNGPLRTLPVALTPLVSDGPIIALVLGVLTRAPAWLLRSLELGGGLFLLWLALGLARGLRNDRAIAPAPVEADRPWRAFLRGVGMNALSPGPWIFWSLVSGPILLRTWATSHARTFAFLLGFYLLLCGGNAALVLLFGTARRLGPGVGRILTGLSALTLGGFGIWQLARAVAALG